MCVCARFHCCLTWDSSTRYLCAITKFVCVFVLRDDVMLGGFFFVCVYDFTVVTDLIFSTWDSSTRYLCAITLITKFVCVFVLRDDVMLGGPPCFLLGWRMALCYFQGDRLQSSFSCTHFRRKL